VFVKNGGNDAEISRHSARSTKIVCMMRIETSTSVDVSILPWKMLCALPKRVHDGHGHDLPGGEQVNQSLAIIRRTSQPVLISTDKTRAPRHHPAGRHAIPVTITYNFYLSISFALLPICNCSRCGQTSLNLSLREVMEVYSETSLPRLLAFRARPEDRSFNDRTKLLPGKRTANRLLSSRQLQK